jgi:hypothetical protein
MTRSLIETITQKLFSAPKEPTAQKNSGVAIGPLRKWVEAGISLASKAPMINVWVGLFAGRPLLQGEAAKLRSQVDAGLARFSFVKGCTDAWRRTVVTPFGSVIAGAKTILHNMNQWLTRAPEPSAALSGRIEGRPSKMDQATEDLLKTLKGVPDSDSRIDDRSATDVRTQFIPFIAHCFNIISSSIEDETLDLDDAQRSQLKNCHASFMEIKPGSDFKANNKMCTDLLDELVAVVPGLEDEHVRKMGMRLLAKTSRDSSLRMFSVADARARWAPKVSY